MIWLVVAVGLILAVFGAMAGGAPRCPEPKRAYPGSVRRLRGHVRHHVPNAGRIDLDLTTTVSPHHLTRGAPRRASGLLVGSGAVRSLFPAGAACGAVRALQRLFDVPRWLTRPGSSPTGWLPCALSSRCCAWCSGTEHEHPVRIFEPSGARVAVGLTTDSELVLVGGVMTFTQRPVREVMTPRTEEVVPRMRRSTTSPRSSRRAAIAGFRLSRASWTKSCGC